MEKTNDNLFSTFLNNHLKKIYIGCMCLLIAFSATFIGFEASQIASAAGQDFNETRNPIFISMTNTGATFARVENGNLVELTAAQAGVNGTANPIIIQRNDHYIVQGGSNSRRLEVQSGLHNVTLTLRNLSLTPIGSPIAITGATVNVILEGTNSLHPTFESWSTSAGIFVPAGATLNLYGPGSLSAIGMPRTTTTAAGIGGITDTSWGTINIYGGTINARGGNGAAGIGSGNFTSQYPPAGGIVRIFGGRVTATGGGTNNAGRGSAGIGGGTSNRAGTVEIYGGTVVATGAVTSIGAGNSGTDQGTLRIFGGSVHRSPNAGATPTSIQNVNLCTVTITGAPNSQIVRGRINGIDLQDVPDQLMLTQGQVVYGGRDLWTNASSQVFLWLPIGVWNTELWTSCGRYFGGTVTINTAGTGVSNFTNTMLPRTVSMPTWTNAAGSGTVPQDRETILNLSQGTTLFAGDEGEVLINTGTGWRIDSLRIGSTSVIIRPNQAAATIWTPVPNATSPTVQARAWFLGANEQIVSLRVRDLTQNLTGIAVNTSRIPDPTPQVTALFVLDNATNANHSQFQPRTVLQGQTISAPTQTPERDGYEFNGWYTASGGVFNFSSPINSHTVIVAGWTEIVPPVEPPDPEYVVILMLGDTQLSLTVTEGLTISPPDDLVREGYTFDGWRSEGKPFDFNQPVTEHTVIYAAWIVNSTRMTTVSFRVGDGTKYQLFQTVAVVQGETVSRPDHIPTRSGFIFENWVMEGSDVPFDFSNPVTDSSIILVAKWFEISTSAVDTGGGSGVGGNGGGDNNGNNNGDGNPSTSSLTNILFIVVATLVLSNFLTIMYFSLRKKKVKAA
jgi:uncharacterized repeat protein (TIGR02543 family)